MKTTLTRSRTLGSNLTKLEKHLPRQSTFASFGHSTEFDYRRDTKHLQKILKNSPTAQILDLDFILQFLSSYNCEQRLLLVHDLEYEYHYNLIDMVLERTESPLRSCALAMLIEPVELYVRDFHDLLTLKLTKKIHHDISRVLIEILSGLNNYNVRKFKETYGHLYESFVEKDIQIVYGEQSLLSKLLIHLLEGNRFEESINSNPIAKIIAEKFFEISSNVSTMDDETFIKIFTHDSFSQLSMICDIYEEKYKRSIVEVIESQCPNKSDVQCFQDIVEFTRSPSDYYSRFLRETLENKSTDYPRLIRILIGHAEKDFDEIKLEYSKLYDETVEDTIHNCLENVEMKRLLIMIMTRRRQRRLTNDNVLIPLDHVNKNDSISSRRRRSAKTISNIRAPRKSMSREAFDKFVNVLKIIRSH